MGTVPSGFRDLGAGVGGTAQMRSLSRHERFPLGLRFLVISIVLRLLLCGRWLDLRRVLSEVIRVQWRQAAN